jgi:hypothetical protein
MGEHVFDALWYMLLFFLAVVSLGTAGVMAIVLVRFFKKRTLLKRGGRYPK